MDWTPATARRKHCRSSRADSFDAVYLRAAQAYMLISMPTDTSTILGAFQVIPSSHEIGANSAPKPNLGPRPTSRKCGRSSLVHLRPGLTADISLMDKVFSLLDKIRRLMVITSKMTGQLFAASGKRRAGTQDFHAKPNHQDGLLRTNRSPPAAVLSAPATNRRLIRNPES